MGRWRDGHGTLTVGSTGAVASGVSAAGPGTLDVSTAKEAMDAPAGAGAADTPFTTVPLEIAASYRARTRGLLGRDGIDGAILLSPAASVHTFRMRFPIDVAYLDRKLNVISVRTMRRGRLSAPRLRARHVLEAEAGSMAVWGIRRGIRLTVATAEL